MASEIKPSSPERVYGYSLVSEADDSDPFGGWDRELDRELDNRRRARVYASGSAAELIPLMRYVITSSQRVSDPDDTWGSPKALLSIAAVATLIEEIETQWSEIARLERLLALVSPSQGSA